MSEKRFPPSSAFAANAHINATRYAEMYAASIADPDAFWREHGKRVDWIKPFSITQKCQLCPSQCLDQMV